VLNIQILKSRQTYDEDDDVTESVGPVSDGHATVRKSRRVSFADMDEVRFVS